MPTGKDFKVEETNDAKKVPRRIAFIKRRTAARVRQEDEDLVMTVPHLVVREIIAFEVMVIVLAVISLLFNAPLESIANPDHTPNPAKAPWYFLGLQELLHYFPPVVGGVILPTLTVIALIVIPYFTMNIKGDGLWKQNSHQTFIVLAVTVGIVCAVLLFFRVYAMAIPTMIITGFMLAPHFSRAQKGFIGWLGTRPLSWWIMTWFVVNVFVLTIVGTLFRGPGWSWTWPWEAIY
jgi:quinol---cytochrome c reductase cytochrome c subunit, bacillus type